MSDNTDHTEKRAFRRMDHSFVASFQIRQPVNDNMAGWDIVTVRNLSAGGVLFNYDRAIPVGTMIDFRIFFPSQDDPIVTVAEIIRVDRPVKFGIIPIAAVFREIDEERKRSINVVSDKLHLGEITGTVLDRLEGGDYEL